jgi:hypothetical protein
MTHAMNMEILGTKEILQQICGALDRRSLVNQ